MPGPAKPFLFRTARVRVRRAAKKAGLPDWLTLAACRHGGLTELGDAQLTEPGVIALSGHGTADAARGYIKRTEAQREAGLLKRRAWVEAINEEHVGAEQVVHESSECEPLPRSRNECRYKALSSWKNWSGQQDSNLRPPAPQTIGPQGMPIISVLTHANSPVGSRRVHVNPPTWAETPP